MDSDSSDIEDASSSDSDDDDGDRVPPYDPNVQERPKLPVYHPRFALTEELVLNVLRTFINYIMPCINSGYDDDEAKHLLEEVKRYKTFKYQDAVRLAVAGDTGVGKSALLNAVLGKMNLTIEVHSNHCLLIRIDQMLTDFQDDTGGTCTCVITEFNQLLPSQSAPFVPEVHFFSLAVCKKMVTDLFGRWYRVKQKQQEDPDDLDDEELGQLSTAADCFQQMFVEHLGTENSESFMGSATSADDPKVLGKLLNGQRISTRSLCPKARTSCSSRLAPRSD